MAYKSGVPILTNRPIRIPGAHRPSNPKVEPLKGAVTNFTGGLPMTQPHFELRQSFRKFPLHRQVGIPTIVFFVVFFGGSKNMKIWAQITFADISRVFFFRESWEFPGFPHEPFQ